jgi:hypothetical protein
MRTLLSFIILMGVKTFAMIFYKMEVKWINSEPTFDRVRLIAFMNHTSLFEPLYIGILPVSFIWRLARKLVAPGADKTLNRRFVGFFWRIMSPGIISITRKRDKSWVKFMEAVHNRSVIAMALEGRMKRPNGFDLNGKKMTVRSGVTDIIEVLEDGNILIAYSGGLHHVQSPGQFIPKVFKTLKLNIEVLDIKQYKSRFNTSGIQWKRDVVADMQMRLETNCPQAN